MRPPHRTRGGRSPKNRLFFSLASICTRTSCSASSSVILPPRVYHITEAIPRSAVRTHLRSFRNPSQYCRERRLWVTVPTQPWRRCPLNATQDAVGKDREEGHPTVMQMQIQRRCPRMAYWDPCNGRTWLEERHCVVAQGVVLQRVEWPSQIQDAIQCDLERKEIVSTFWIDEE